MTCFKYRAAQRTSGAILLALIAATEAARAGKNGRGFAGVADGHRSDDRAGVCIQAATESAVLAMDGIGARTREVDGLTGAVTEAIQGQVKRHEPGVTRCPGSCDADRPRLHPAQRGVGGGTATAAGQVRQTTDDLGRQSGHLSLEIERFIAGIG